MDEQERTIALPARTAVIVSVSVALIPVAYFLSIGPATAMLNTSFRDWAPPAAFYAPLLWAAEHCELLNFALKRYIALWVGLLT
jgi:hypothetical protein